MNYFFDIENPFLIQSQNTILLDFYVLIFMSKANEMNSRKRK
jgi:hypothetical protein